MAKYLDKTGLQDFSTKLYTKLKSVFAVKGEYATDEQVASAVTDWLDTNVDPVGSAVVVDSTLSISGAAADAKMVGDEIAVLKDDIGVLPVEWEQGAISGSTGAESSSNKYIRTDGYIGQEVTRISALEGYSFCLLAYDSSNTYIGAWNNTNKAWQKADPFATDVDVNFIRCKYPTYKYRLKLKRTDFANISVSESRAALLEPSCRVEMNTNDIDAEAFRAILAERGLASGFVYEPVKNGLYVGGLYNGDLLATSTTDMVTYAIQSITEDCFLTTDWSKYQCFVDYYVNGSYDSNSGWIYKDFSLSAGENIRFIVRKKDGTALTDSDKQSIVANTFYKKMAYVGERLDNLADYAGVRTAVIESGDILLPVSFESGSINGSGNETASDSIVRTVGFISEPGEYLLKANGQILYTYKYNADGTFVSGVSPWGTTEDYKLTIGTGYKYRFATGGSSAPVTVETNRFTIYRRTRIKDTYDSIVYDNAYVSIPDYFVANVQNGIDRYLKIKNNIIGDSFCFLTDVHVQTNRMNSGAILRYIGKNTDCKKVFCGGDVSVAYNSSASVDTLEGYASDWLAQMRKFKDDMSYYGMRGNHDIYMYDSSSFTTLYQLPYSSAYALTCGANGEVSKTGGYGTMYYAVDNTMEKIRYICVDTSDTSDTKEDSQERMRMTQEQLQWIADTMMEVDDGWSIIVLGHVPASDLLYGFPEGYQTAIDEMTALGSILIDYKNKRSTNEYGDFTNAKGELVAYICGHAHTDFSAVDDGMLFVQITCDSRAQIDRDGSDYNWLRSSGTVSEQALDIFTVDTLNKKLYATRIGAGGYGDAANGINDPEDIFDRVWDY